MNIELGNNIGKIIYGAVGFLLTAATVFTGSYGLSQENRRLYEEALSLQEKVEKVGFQDFQLADYKVRFYNGTKDYVVIPDTAGVQIQSVVSQQPVFDTFVGTTYEIEGEYQVILPTLEHFAKLFDLLGTAEQISEGSLSFEQAGYGRKEHIATLWHEAFHAYQMTHYIQKIQDLLPNENFAEEMQEIIVEDVDSQENVVKYLKEEVNLLKKAYQTSDLSQKQAIISEYFTLEEQRIQLLSPEAQTAEQYYELIEGTACYMESVIYQLEYNTEKMEEHYIQGFSYENGSGKYYKIGLLKCYLLTQLKPDWNRNYQFEKSLNELLWEVCR